MVWIVFGLLAIVLVPSGSPAAEVDRQQVAVTQLNGVTVSTEVGTTTVRLRTSGPARYRAVLMDSPDRIVVDLEDTTYLWQKRPRDVSEPPLKQIRGSQYRKGVARVVVELTRRVGYAIHEDADGLSIVIPTALLAAGNVVHRGSGASQAEPVPRPLLPAASDGTSESSRASSEEPVAAASAETPIVPALKSTPATDTPVVADKAVPAPAGPVLAEQRAVSEPKAATTPRPAPAAPGRDGPLPAVRIAQAQTPAPATPAPPSGPRLISLDFKDADVVNLLRILAAESGRNIVIGEDVKGKMSIALRNVPWELALDTILESRGLQRVERDGVLRITSTEQLTKEREAKARIEEAKLKSEAEIRAKVAEAEVKEAEAQSRKLAVQAAAKEAEARGPLKEDTIRLSYGDAEEVAKTLQGILGIPAEGQKIEGLGVIGGAAAPPIAEPPFSQLYGQQPTARPPAGPISVSQDVLNKGLSIRSHKPTNTIFLRLYAADLERVKKIIRESLDIQLPQVKIEARMEILDRNALEQIGIQWGGFMASKVGTQTLVGQGLQTTQVGGQTVPFVPGRVDGSTNIVDAVPPLEGSVNPRNTNLILRSNREGESGGMPVSFRTGLPLGGNLVNLPINALPNSGPLPAAGLAFGIVGTSFNINLALQALAEQGKTRTLARPEVVTVENNKATMSLGEEIPYATISSAGTQIQFKEALLKLEVTPTVIHEGDVTKIKLLVVVENNSRGQVVNLGNAGQPPAINRRKAETQVLVREGERLVVGGVTTAVNQNTVRRVPILGDIPLLGWLFKQKENFEQGREMVVFLTPSVLRTDAPAVPGASPTAAPAPTAVPAPPAVPASPGR